MKKTMMAFICMVFLGSSVSAGESAAVSLKDFAAALNGAKKGAVENSLADTEKPEPAKAGKTPKSQYVTLSDYVTLRGSGFIPQNGGYVTIYVSGWVQFRDSSGKYTTDRVYINERCSFWVRDNQYIREKVYVSETVSVYKDGKYAGTLRINDTMYVSGWPSSNHVTLSGSGYLRASGYVSDVE